MVTLSGFHYRNIQGYFAQKQTRPTPVPRVKTSTLETSRPIRCRRAFATYGLPNLLYEGAALAIGHYIPGPG